MDKIIVFSTGEKFCNGSRTDRTPDEFFKNLQRALGIKDVPEATKLVGSYLDDFLKWTRSERLIDYDSSLESELTKATVCYLEGFHDGCLAAAASEKVRAILRRCHDKKD